MVNAVSVTGRFGLRWETCTYKSYCLSCHCSKLIMAD